MAAEQNNTQPEHWRQELNETTKQRDTYRHDNIALSTELQTFKIENDKLVDYTTEQRDTIETLENDRTILMIANEKLNTHSRF